MDTIKRQLNNLFCGTGKDIVLIDASSGKTVSRQVFLQTIIAWAEKLGQSNVNEVIVRCDNCIELAIFYFSAMLANAIVIAVDPEKAEGELMQICSNHERAVFYDTNDIKMMFAELEPSSAASSFSLESIDLNKPYLITYTSGSTGQPKGTIHSAGNLFLSAYEFGVLMQYGKDTVMGHCMPMTYMAGILNTLIMPLLLGGSAIIMERFSMKTAFSFWKDVKGNGVNTLWLSPTMLRIVNMLDKRGDMKNYFHENDMKISVGTAPLDIELRRDFEGKYEIRLYQSYGLSETLFISTETLEEKESQHTVGRLLPSVNLTYAPDGEILINVPWIFYGYTNADTGEFMFDGNYLSGDLGNFTENKNLIISGRKKDLIVRGGYNINPCDIENTMIECFRVDECIVVPINAKREEQIACCYVSAHSLNLSEVNSAIEKELGKHYRIDLLEKRKDLPKNLNGKADRKKLREDLGKRYDLKT